MCWSCHVWLLLFDVLFVCLLVSVVSFVLSLFRSFSKRSAVSIFCCVRVSKNGFKVLGLCVCLVFDCRCLLCVCLLVFVLLPLFFVCLFRILGGYGLFSCICCVCVVVCGVVCVVVFL